MIIYVAGAIDLADGTDRLEYAVSEINRNNMVAFKPWGGISTPDEISIYGSDIQRINYAAIQACDATLAIISDTMSVGTVMDMQYAQALGKPVVVWLDFDGRCPAYLHDYWKCNELKLCIKKLDADLERQGITRTPPDAHTITDPLLCRVDISGRPPDRAHADDAGLDIYLAESFSLVQGGRRDARTDICVAVPPGTFGLLIGRSSAFYKRGLHVQTAIIDPGWRGELKIGVQNVGPNEVWLAEGERIAQLLILPVRMVSPVVVGTLPPGSRGEDGYGSSGV
jgi:dUTP pyrophosphatase